jgi:hypothetical protein
MRQALRSGMPLEFTTAPDERERCCVGVGDRRCRGTTRWRFAPVGTDEHELELYVFACSDCAAMVAAEFGAEYQGSRLGSVPGRGDRVAEPDQGYLQKR